MWYKKEHTKNKCVGAIATQQCKDMLFKLCSALKHRRIMLDYSYYKKIYWLMYLLIIIGWFMRSKPATKCAFLLGEGERGVVISFEGWGANWPKVISTTAIIIRGFPNCISTMICSKCALKRLHICIFQKTGIINIPGAMISYKLALKRGRIVGLQPPYLHIRHL